MSQAKKRPKPQNFPTIKHPNSKTSQLQKVPTIKHPKSKTSQALKCPKPQSVPKRKHTKPHNVLNTLYVMTTFFNEKILIMYTSCKGNLLFLISCN